jgi:bacterioferritin-associated ferredoxin
MATMQRTIGRRSGDRERRSEPLPQGFLEPFQSGSAPVWNHLKMRFFLLHPTALLNIDEVSITDGPAVFMIVCSCNVLTDHDVRSAVTAAEGLPRNAKQVYGCLGCSAECGRCARTIKTIIDEALGACAKACCSGCPHSQGDTSQVQSGLDGHIHTEFALAAS